MENGNQPINPVVKSGFVYADGSHEESSVIANGLTKREYFAGLAMQGLISKYKLNEPEDQEIISKLSVQLSDSLLTALTQSPAKAGE